MNQNWEKRLGFLNRIHWEKTVIWGLFLFFIYIISGFFGLAFLTFILCYIFHHLSTWVIRRFFNDSSRSSVRIIVVSSLYTLLAGSITVLLILIGPNIYDNASNMVDKVKRLEDQQKIEKGIVTLLQTILPADQQDGSQKLIRKVLSLPQEKEDEARSLLDEFLKEKQMDPAVPRINGALDGIFDQITKYRNTKGLKNIIATWVCRTFKVKRSNDMDQLLDEGESYVMGHLPTLVKGLNNFLGSLFQGLVTMMLAVIFSFLILLDLPRIGQRVDMLAKSRLSRFYEEIKPTMIGFATVIGKAFQAQTLIAFLNTAFTLVGMQILGMDHAIVLSIIVFVCSFVPVAGVFISTTPMVLVALQMETGGVSLGLKIMILVTVIHMLEAYVFNPRIMGEFLHMHPIFVLLILVISEHFFHIWGLLLGVPVVFYVFTQVLRNNEDEATPPESG